ncbi:hypothetical protein O6H91_06G046200 [Diphasiastrum complanatum]|uniref:Uncharacterized protein n=1 Tax=Diphasiastrum complanatum TaxID=34168 RepID=A0ACC2DCZ1_DIPCM|nr:hypothetical protein O6H91_06G046200 [Diphasiastrum complanatum]
MSEIQALGRQGKPVRSLLAVQCGRRTWNGRVGVQESNCRGELHGIGVENQSNVWKTADFDFWARDDSPKLKDDQQGQTLNKLATGGRLEVQLLDCPTKDELRQKLEVAHPDIVVFLGEEVSGTNEIGPLLLGDLKVSSPDIIKSLFSTNLPELIYFEVAAAGRLAEVLHGMGVLNVIFWKSSVTLPLAIQFRQALLAALRSPGCGVWEAFQLAKASFQMHCSQLRFVGATNGQQHFNPVQPIILGDLQELSDPPLKIDSGSEEGSPSSGYPIIQIFDDEVQLRLLVCAEACTSDMKPLRAIEDGLGALLSIEARGLRLIHRISAPPPPTASFARGIITMRCDLCTSSSARISLLVSGSARTCFNDQLLESSIRKELVERSRLIHLVTTGEEDKSIMQVELRRSVSVACGAAAVELRLKTSGWAVQALRQLSTEVGYRSLVALGIAGVEGAPVAAFQKEDAERLASLKPNQTAKDKDPLLNIPSSIEMTVPPPWLAPAAPVRKRQILSGESGTFHGNSSMTSGPHHFWQLLTNFPGHVGYEVNEAKERALPLAAMKPIPHTSRHKLMPFAGVFTAGAHSGWSMKVTPNGSTGRIRSAIGTFLSGVDSSSWLPLNPYKQTSSNASFAPFIIPIPAMVKKHDCQRPPISECSEDVMQFLSSRGHGRLIPPMGVETFPDAVLNGKRLDLYNLYREVVSRGGFRVGNGINWKGQVFAKMRNHTLTNKMTGVGNTLKKHYETYLLEYELAHDDVGGDCCIICHSGAEGDWVNCGMCGEWAHFGCDRRMGLGSFKDYAKTDGLDYICPRCSVANLRGIPGRKKSRMSIDGHYSLPPSLSKSVQKRSLS